jgi:excisionase family DNA binding protein
MEKIIVTTHSELETLIQNTVRNIFKEQTTKPKESANEIFSLDQACQYLNLAKQTIYGFTSKRKIPFIKKGKKLYFKLCDLEKWLETGRKKSKSEIFDELSNKGN